MWFQTRKTFVHLQHKLRYYWWNPRAFWPCIDSLEYFLSKKRLYSTISSFPCKSSTRVHENTTAMFSLRTKSILVASQNYCWTTDVTWTILTMSLLPFWALNVVVTLLSMKGQKVLGFYQKYLNLCSEDERKSYGFITTWGRVINDRIFIFWLTIPLTYCLIEKKVPISESKTKQVQLPPLCRSSTKRAEKSSWDSLTGVKTVLNVKFSLSDAEHSSFILKESLKSPSEPVLWIIT